MEEEKMERETRLGEAMPRGGEGGNEPEDLQLELAQLRESASKQEENQKAYLDQIKRTQADFENWRKRVEQEKLLLVETANSALVQKLLPVLDNFERALQASPSTTVDTAYKEGMELIYRQLLELLKQEGLSPIEALGKIFDPTLHEAYSYEERDDCEDHRVLEEARKGYMFKGKVLRPALVKVAKCRGESKDEKGAKVYEIPSIELLENEKPKRSGKH